MLARLEVAPFGGPARPASTEPTVSTLPPDAPPVELPADLDEFGATVERYLPDAHDRDPATDRPALALDVWRRRLREWAAEHGVTVAELRRAGQWPSDPPPWKIPPGPYSPARAAGNRFRARARAAAQGREPPEWAAIRVPHRPPAATESERRARLAEQARAWAERNPERSAESKRRSRAARSRRRAERVDTAPHARERPG